MGWAAIIFASSLITVFVVLAGKNDILNTTTDSWMSMANFTDLIKASYDVFECVNIYICGESEGTRRIVKEFITIYPNSYTVNRVNHFCDKYFAVATSQETFLANLDSIPADHGFYILIIIDDIIEEPTRPYWDDDTNTSGPFSALQSRLWNANIAARNGLWSLTENVADSGEFIAASSYEDMVHRGNMFDFEGEVLQVATIYNPPFSFLNSTVNRTVYGIETQWFIAEEGSEFDGVELKLFLLLAKRLNFTYMLRKPSDGYRHGYGSSDNRTWNGGLLGLISSQQVHMAFGSVSFTWNNYAVTKYLITPWQEIHLNFLVPRPKPHESYWALITPLTSEVWAALFTMLIAQSVCIYSSARINRRIPKRFRSFTATWIEMIGRLIGMTATKDMQDVKLLLLLWHFIGVLLVTAYSSSLAAKLASKQYDKRIDTLQDFIKANLTWGLEESDDPSSYFDMSDPYAKLFPDRYVQEKNEAERHEKILKGNYAILGQLVDSTFFPLNLIRMEDLKNYRLMKESISAFYATFPVQSDWMQEPINMILLWMQETGLVQYHLSDVISRRTYFALREVMIEHDINNENDARVLELKPLLVAFLLYLVGFGLSTIVFYFELRSARGSRSIRELLLDIQNGRAIWYAEKLRRKRLHSILMKLKSDAKARYAQVQATDVKEILGIKYTKLLNLELKYRRETRVK